LNYENTNFIDILTIKFLKRLKLFRKILTRIFVNSSFLRQRPRLLSVNLLCFGVLKCCQYFKFPESIPRQAIGVFFLAEKADKKGPVGG